jgi:hypothetical protein
MTWARRRFFSRLTALGALLTGVVPELRANVITPNAPPLPAPSLPPAGSAMLYASALGDADIRRLLGGIGPGLTVSAPVQTYDMGSQGRGAAMPVKDGGSTVVAYLLYGTASSQGANGQAMTLPIKVLLKSDGTANVLYGGQVLQPPPEAAETVELLYGAFFTEEFVESKTATVFASEVSALKKKGGSGAALPAAGVNACQAKYRECLRNVAGWFSTGVWSHLACLICLCTGTATGGLCSRPVQRPAP